jgi:hypothetical protein
LLSKNEKNRTKRRSDPENTGILEA